MSHPDTKIRTLSRQEFEIAIEWAAQEGWNPGLHDADIFWDTDNDGYLGIEQNNEIIGLGSIVSYEGNFGFMGFFIVRPDLRGQGIGTKLWFHRRDTLKRRLKSGAAIGMDGVFDMQEWYAKGDFTFSHRNLRMEGIAKAASPHPSIRPLDQFSFEEISNYDQIHFGFPRDSFLKKWIRPKKGLALGFINENKLSGIGVMRKCRVGYKIGPLFADSPDIADALFSALSNDVSGEAIVLDTPENNPHAIALAEQNSLKEVFGCARMYHGPAPDLPWRNIYGITTFELG